MYLLSWPCLVGNSTGKRGRKEREKEREGEREREIVCMCLCVYRKQDMQKVYSKTEYVFFHVYKLIKM